MNIDTFTYETTDGWLIFCRYDEIYNINQPINEYENDIKKYCFCPFLSYTCNDYLVSLSVH